MDGGPLLTRFFFAVFHFFGCRGPTLFHFFGCRRPRPEASERTVVEAFECVVELSVPQRTPEPGSPGDLEPEGSTNMEGMTQITTQAGDMDGVLKFLYFVTGIAGAAIFGIYSGYRGNATGRVHDIYVKICIGLIIAAFVSGAGLMLLTSLHPRFQYLIQIVTLRLSPLGFLTLALLDIGIVFLKAGVALYLLLAFTPVLVVIMFGFTYLCKDQVHQVNSSTQEREEGTSEMMSDVCEEV